MVHMGERVGEGSWVLLIGIMNGFFVKQGLYSNYLSLDYLNYLNYRSYRNYLNRLHRLNQSELASGQPYSRMLLLATCRTTIRYLGAYLPSLSTAPSTQCIYGCAEYGP